MKPCLAGGLTDRMRVNIYGGFIHNIFNKFIKFYQLAIAVLVHNVERRTANGPAECIRIQLWYCKRPGCVCVIFVSVFIEFRGGLGNEFVYLFVNGLFYMRNPALE